MQNGISVYAGLDCTIDENVILIETAASLGLNRMFTSAIIPEAEADSLEFAAILACAVENDFEIILDVTPETIATFDFEQITLRLDDGFTPMQIAALSHLRRVMLNASTVGEGLLLNLMDLSANFENISALHNFYPHVHTGLDVSYFRQQTHLLKSFGLTVGSFVASLEGRRRPPLREGLPTVEVTRNFSTDRAARYLAALGSDFILISDSLPTRAECAAVATVSSSNVILQADLLTDNPICLNLLNHSFTTRPDQSHSLIRAANSRSILATSGDIIPPSGNPSPRTRGTVTIDNSDFGRYMGEVQIVKHDLPPDPRVNVVAKISDDDLLLLDCLGPSHSFSFHFVNQKEG